MKYQELVNHLESYGCTIDHFFEDSYWVGNCISGESCIIEKLSRYTDITLCHYFYELGVPAPEHLREDLETYRSIRKHIGSIVE